MTQLNGPARSRSLLLCGVAAAVLFGLTAGGEGQEGFRSTNPRFPRNDPRQSIPSLSEATAILESAVRNLYTNIEPGRETSPNELIAYADLRALRLYVGALEVAGWDLEQAAANYAELTGSRFNDRRFPNGNWGGGGNNSARVEEARDRYMAFRETVRTLLYRVRTTAVAAEHQVSFCDPRINREWQQQVVPALMDTISATQPLFQTEATYISYHVPGQNPNVIQTSNSGIPSNAVEITQATIHKPYDGRGRGQGRYFEIRAYGGPIRVKTIRYRSHENAFGVIGTSVQRELSVNQVTSPSQPLYIPCNRERFVDLSELEVEWEAADSRRRTYGTIDVVADRPSSRD